MPLTIRPATFADFEAILKLISSCNQADYDAPMISAGNLRDSWRSSRLSLALDTWTAFNPEGELVGYAELEHGEADEFFPMLYIRRVETLERSNVETFQRRELALELLRRAEKRALACCGGGHLLLMGSRVSGRDPQMQQAFEDHGYTKKYSFLIMERVVDTPPEPAHWPDGVIVRPFVPGKDEQAVYLVDEKASEDKGYHAPLSFEDWARRMNLHTADPSLWFLACAGDEIIGAALNLYAAETDTGWVDHLGVLRPWRNRGLGKALLLHSLAAFYARGVSRVRLSVDSHSLTNAPRLYETAGLAVIQQYHIYRKESHIP